MKIKLFVSLLLVLMCGFRLHADDTSKSLLDAMSSKVATFKSYEVQFSVNMPGGFGDIEGRFVVSGSMYYVIVGDSELFFDGKLKQTYNSDNNEVVIELSDPGDNSILSNPTRFFTLYNNDFNHSYRGRINLGSVKCEQVELTPKNPNAGYNTIFVSIDSATKLPKLLKYRFDGSEMVINIDKITPNIAVNSSTFVFDKSKYKGVEVIDFR